MKFFFRFFCLVLAEQLLGFSLNVETRNGISNALKTPEKIQVLKLQAGMQPIATLDSPKKVQQVKDLPKMENSPYLIQVTYKNVRYSKLVPPNTKDNTTIRVNVYEKTSSFEGIKMTSLWSMRYLEGDKLENILMYSFDNSTGKTYSEPDGGIYAFLPPDATNIKVSVSSSGMMGFQWIPVVYERGNSSDKFSRLKYPIKPVESGSQMPNRVYQIKFDLDYDGTERKIEMGLPYSTIKPMVIFAQPGSIGVFDDTGKKFETRVNSQLNNEEIIDWDLNKKSNRFSFLTIKGGEPLPAPPKEGEGESKTVQITAPLSFWEKMLLLILGGLVFFIPIYRFGLLKPFLVKYWEKTLSQCLREKDLLSEANIPESVRLKRLSDLEKQINKLGKLLENAN